MKKLFFWLTILIFVSIVLVASVRGVYGNPTEETFSTSEFTEDGPMELSPERGRFALTYSITENKSFYFSVPVARFTLPDLGYKDGNYVSLFAPGVSFLAIPGYTLGKQYNLAQVGAFLTISLFALLNFILVIKIATKLGAAKSAAVIGAICFLFASPAFSYSVTLYQHHVSTFLILGSLYLLFAYKGLLSLFLVWFLTALSIPVDYPNLFLMFPIGIYAALKNIKIQKSESTTSLSIPYKSILATLGVLVPFMFFTWFNYSSYGNPLQFSGTVPGVDAMDEAGHPVAPEGTSLEDVEAYVSPDLQQKSAFNFFNSRNLLNGLYVHTLSPDRGIFMFTPVLLFGTLGIYYLAAKRKKNAAIITSIGVINLVLYSLWGDPWGGWGFGSRYLVPAYSLLGIGSAFFIDKVVKKPMWIALFLVALSYSLFVGVSGALTTSAIPPKIQVEALQEITGKKESYNFNRGLEMLNDGRSKSFLYQFYGYKYLSAWNYFALMFSAIYGFVFLHLIALVYTKSKKHGKNS